MRLCSGLLVLCLAAVAAADTRYKAGQHIRKTLPVANTWVFCDEDHYGAFVLGKVDGTLLWVKLPVKYRWLTATSVRKAKKIEFSGIVKGPRGDGVQVDKGEVHTVDGVSVGQMDIGLDWNYVEKTLFARDLTDAIRASRWERMDGMHFAEVGLITELSAARDVLKVKFRKRTITWDAEIRLKKPVGKASVEWYRKDAFVKVEGKLAEYRTLNGSVVVKEGEASIIQPKSGSWTGLR